MSQFLVLLQISIRNLFASWLNLIIGAIIFAGTCFFVVGGSLMGSVNESMSRSLTGSVTGHIQVYSAKSKDDLSIFNNLGTQDLEALPDFTKIKGPISSVDNVKGVIPMGVDNAVVSYGNSIDVALEKIRKAENQRLKGDHSRALAEKTASLISHLKQILAVLQNDFRKLSVIGVRQDTDVENQQLLDKATSSNFWAAFEHDPLGHLEFLENKIAPLLPDAEFAMLRYVGTDLDTFRKTFDRMEIVDGQMVPSGHRGMLLSKFIYEFLFKLKTAHRLDQIHEGIHDEGKKIAKDAELRQLIKQNQNQTREIIFQLDPISYKTLTERVQKLLGSQEADLAKLLSQYFTMDDSNFDARYKFFYDQIAPLVELYRLRPGDLLTIKAYTRSGFMQSVNVKVYGTFQFKGMEKSGLAGGVNLMDLMTFRDLYGYVSPEKLEEIKQIEKAAGAKMLDRDQAEAELFGGTSVVAQGKEQRIDDKAQLGDRKALVRSENLVDHIYSQDEIEKGMILNAAVILKDGSKLGSTLRKIEQVSKDNGLELKVVDWQKASGMLGQFVFVAKAVLYAAVAIIFIVALVIINNAVMMATLQRIREIGTMRAIGAQRSFVLAMVLIETICLGVVFGTAGTLLGSLIIHWLGNVGIPAGNQFLYIFFSGPRLYPWLGLGTLVGAFMIILVVTGISSLYPAIIATRVSPVRAMSSED